MFKKIWGWIKRHKKLTILLLVVLLIVAAVLFVRAKAKEAMAQLTELAEETAFVERRSIQSSVSSTGEVISDNTRSLTTTLAGIEVLTVDVEVGDVVAEGDVLCTFDTEDIEDKLEDAEDSLSAAKSQSRLSVDSARRSLEMAVETKNYQIENAARGVISADESHSNAVDAYDEAKDNCDDAKSAMDAAKQTLATGKAAYEATPEYTNYTTAKAAYDTALADYTATPTDPVAISAFEAAATSYNAAEAALAARAEYSVYKEAEAKVASASATYNTLSASLSQLESAVNSTHLAYDNAIATYEYTIAAQESQYDGSVDGLTGAKVSAGVSTIQQESTVKTYKEQLEKGALKASIPGTVTAVNVKVGDTYSGGAIVTIQDCSALIVSAEIDEYDIADIKLGMKAVFKTDATRDEQLEGEVIFISPTPTQGSDVTYQVKVAIKTATDRLRIGMNAKLNIILLETENVLTVPFDAIQQDENGNDTVTVVERGADGSVSRTAVPVTVGTEGDYYVEISGDIKEGMEVVMPSDEMFDMMEMMMQAG